MNGVYWILKNKIAYPTENIFEWAEFFENDDLRRVKEDQIGDSWISTFFIGLDHRYGGEEPVLFETMIFGGKHDQWQDRASTWPDAEEMHDRAVEMVKMSLNEEENSDVGGDDFT